jgi:LPS export ABC transporter protein LptC
MPAHAEKGGYEVTGRAALRRWTAVLAALCSLLGGCSLDYSSAEEEEQTPDIPDTVAIGLVHKVHKDGRLALQLEAAQAETYNKKNQTILTDAHFVEYNDNGETTTEGSGGQVVFHTDTKNAEITGSVQVHSATEEGGVTAESLSWEDTTRMLTAPPDETVVISKDDGSSLSGAGFVGDFKRREVTFSSAVRGTYIYEKKKEQ